MDVLDAIMKIITDLFLMNNIPGTTTNTIVGMMKGFVQGIMTFVEMLQKLFEMFSQGGFAF